MTKLFEWLEVRLDEGGWVRRAYLVAATVMVWKFMLWAMGFAETSPRIGSDVAMILTAIGVPLSSVTGFAFSQYLKSRT